MQAEATGRGGRGAVMNGTRGSSVSVLTNGFMESSPPSGMMQFETSTAAGIGQMSMTDVTLEQALERVRVLDKDNNELREFLKVNNEVMKEQYENLAKWKEKIHENNVKNKDKFEQTKKLIANLTKENSDLKNKVQAQVNHAGEIHKRDNAISHLNQEVSELHTQIGRLQADKTREVNETVLVEMSNKDMQKLQAELTDIKARLTASENQNVQFRGSNEQLLQDLETYTKVKDELQRERTNLETENTELTQRLQNVLGDSKTSKLELKTAKARITELEEELAKLNLTKPKDTEATNLGYSLLQAGPGEVTKLEERKQTSASGTSTQLQREEELVKRLKQQIREKDSLIERYHKQQEKQISDLNQAHQYHEKELMKQLDNLNQQLHIAKEEQSMTYTCDIQSLRSQVLTLINEVTESQNKLKVTEDTLEKKNKRIFELELSLQKRIDDATTIETLRISLNSNEEALNAERKEHQITKKQMADLRQSFNQIMAENKDINETFEKYKKQEKSRVQGASEVEKQKLLDQIGQLTAQLLGAEEAINYRDSQMKQLRNENKTLKDELENTVAVLKAQADLWKSDFDAERDARERLHAEKEKIDQELKQLQIQNQQLLDELESLSKSSFAQMQQKHAHVNQPYHQNLQQHLRVGQPNQYYQPYPYPQHKYPDHDSTQSPGSGEVRGPPSFGQPTSLAAQHEEEPAELSCPKCNVTCPDMDTLQIHVLDCIDQEVI